MDDLDVTRTRASVRTVVSGTWVGGVGLIFASGLVAPFIAGMLLVGDNPPAWPAVAAAVALPLVVGGTLAGLLARRDVPGMGMIGALLMPVPAVVVALVFGLGASLTGEERLGAVAIAVLLFGLWEVPLVLTLLVVDAIRRRTTAVPAIQPPGPPPLSRELTAATRSGRAVTVVREYVDDPGGQAHLQADTEALFASGYGLVSIEKRPGRRGIFRALTFTKDLLLLFTPLGGTDSDAMDDHVVATFRRSV